MTAYIPINISVGYPLKYFNAAWQFYSEFLRTFFKMVHTYWLIIFVNCLLPKAETSQLIIYHRKQNNKMTNE